MGEILEQNDAIPIDNDELMHTYSKVMNLMLIGAVNRQDEQISDVPSKKQDDVMLKYLRNVQQDKVHHQVEEIE
jgi:hypothetical protein